LDAQADEIRSAELEQNEFNFENNFDGVEVKDVYDHFKIGLVKSGMLTEDELQEFLKAAFQNKVKPITLFRLSRVETKNKAMKVFYQYFIDIAGKPHGRQVDYAGLLGDYFQGYKTSNVSSNFSKSVY